MQAPCENKEDYAARLEKEREIHAATRENTLRQVVNLTALPPMPYLRPEDKGA
jgi:hypothetical protein